MLRKVFELYKTPLLLSITLAVIIIALDLTKNPLFIAYVLLGSVFGTFLLDLDYFIYAFFTDPESEFSKMIQGFVNDRDVQGVLTYIHYHKSSLRERTLNSALFQIILAAITLYVVLAGTNLFLKAFILSAFLNSIYRLIESYYDERGLGDWFWAFKMTPDRRSVTFYSLALGAVFLYCLSLF